jgi:anti-anti-sigma regulatory factor
MQRLTRGVSVSIRGNALVHLDGNSRFEDGTLHLEIVRLMALGCNDIALDLDNILSLDDDTVSEIVSWKQTLEYRNGLLRLVNVRPEVAKQLERSNAFVALATNVPRARKPSRPYSPLQSTLRLLNASTERDEPTEAAR